MIDCENVSVWRVCISDIGKSMSQALSVEVAAAKDERILYSDERARDNVNENASGSVYEEQAVIFHNLLLLHQRLASLLIDGAVETCHTDQAMETKL
jgi:hypothetical protein